MNINPIELKDFVENNTKLVTHKESKRYPGLFVLKYTRRVFYENLWHLNPLLLECRGLVVDKDYNVVIKPFTKVFNHHENGTNIDSDELCTAVRKVNGFLGVATYAPQISDNVIYSTTGSLDSDFAILAEKHIDWMSSFIKEQKPSTWLFEVCDESDPHIIPEIEGAHLIGCIRQDGRQEDEIYLDSIADYIGCERPEAIHSILFSDIVQETKNCKHEGFMVYGHESGTALKIKSPYYLATKFLARAGEAKITDLLIRNNRQEFRRRFDEEFYDLIDYLIYNSYEFVHADERHRIRMIREYLGRM